MEKLKHSFEALILFLMIVSTSLFAQSNQQNNLERVTSFVEENYRTNWNAIPDSARKMLTLSKEIGDRQQEANANKFLGVYYFRKSVQDSAILFYTEAAEINKELGNTLEIAKNTLNIGVSYRDLGEYENTISYSLEAARYFKEVDDFKGLAIVYNMIGSVYYYQSRFNDAIENMEIYLEFAVKSEDIYEIASANQNLGAVLSAADRDIEAIPYLDKASKLHKETGNKLGEINNSINVGSIYFNNEEYAKALPYYEGALTAGKELGNKRAMLEAYINISKSLINLDRNEAALIYIKDGMNVAEEAEDLFMEMELLKAKSSALFNLRQFENAFIVQQEYQEAKDSLINQENLEAIAELETLYESEQKEKQIAELETEKALQELTIQKNRVVQSGMGGVLVVLIVAGFLWQSKVKERELSFKVEQLEVEKEIQRERERISRDLHDNVGAQLVNIISGIDLVERYKNVHKEVESNKVLISLKEEAKSSINQLRDTIWALKSDENSSESFIDHVNGYLKSVENVSELTVKTELADLQMVELTPTQSLNIFRIIQEATQNVIKHAEATKISVFAHREGAQLTLSIVDDGTFKKSSQDGTSSGLGNMTKRAKDIGGVVTIDIQDEGTSVVLSQPVKVRQDGLAAA